MRPRSFTIACKELVVLARDRQAAALLFGMPAVFVLFLSLALEGVYGEKKGVRLALVLENEDRGELAGRIEEKLRASEFEIVARPAGLTDAELFRSGGARAVVRIPDGFSRAVEDYLGSAGEAPFGPSRIGWEASPALDAPYRWLIEARLAAACASLFQEELARQQEELGRELEEMGGELEDMGAELEKAGEELEDMAAKLEETGSLLASTASELESTVTMLARARELLGGTPQELKELALVATAEEAASAEAAAVRAQLAARGALPEGVSLEEPEPPKLSFEPPPRGAPAPGERFAARRTRDSSKGAEDVELARGERAGEPPRGADDEKRIETDADLFLSESAGKRRVLPTPLQQTVPGWSLFAMFFLVVPLSQGLHRERSDGTLRRLFALAVPRSSIVLGKLAPYVLVGMLQFAGMLLVGMFVVPMFSELSLDLGARPAVLVPITFACALAAASYGLLVASLTRTPEQAAAFGATSVIVLAVLGGVMVPHFVMPAVMQELALVSPLYWGHQAYLAAFLHGAGLEEVSRALFVLVAFALVCLAVAARRVARQP
jgi:hypothetical protein